jgi:hypothetical protein
VILSALSSSFFDLSIPTLTLNLSLPIDNLASVVKIHLHCGFGPKTRPDIPSHAQRLADERDMPDIKELQQKANTLHGQYSFRFAGHARITRDLKALDKLIEDTRALVAEVESFNANGDAAARDTLLNEVKERADLYTKERAEIVTAQADGPAAKEASLLAARANFIINRYRRHFANRERKSRDTGLLSEMIQDLQRIKEEMRLMLNVHPLDSLESDLKVVSQNIETYIRERAEILNARDRLSLDDKFSNFANLANAQFRIYETNFAGKSRASRRPGLLQRIIDNLVDVQKGMNNLGIISEVNDKNIQIVEDRLQLYRGELVQIERARTEVDLEGVTGELGGAANAIMEEYGKSFAGHDRRTRDLDAMGTLCDLMGEVERQMHAIALQRNIDMNINNLSIVRDGLSMFDREYVEIQNAKQSPATA